MTRPQYVRDLSDVYTEMYYPSGNERPLTEKQMNDDDHDYDIPEWKRLLHKHAQKEEHKRPPHAAYVEPSVDTEEDENENIGVGSEFMTAFLDDKEAQNREVDDAAQEYLKTIIDDIPAAVGGINLHSVVRDAFTAGARSHRN